MNRSFTARLEDYLNDQRGSSVINSQISNIRSSRYDSVLFESRSSRVISPAFVSCDTWENVVGNYLSGLDSDVLMEDPNLRDKISSVRQSLENIARSTAPKPFREDCGELVASDAVRSSVRFSTSDNTKVDEALERALRYTQQLQELTESLRN